LWVSFFIGDEEFWVALPREHIEHPVSQVLLIWGGVVLALALFGAYFIARQVARPLRRLAQAAQQVGQGATPQPLPESGAQEIVAVSRAFNQMSADLAADGASARWYWPASRMIYAPAGARAACCRIEHGRPLREGLVADVGADGCGDPAF
jgi:two-component system osmolarity sensor histidine kinase EnvZ